jgi:hypothetical protein
LPTSDNVVETGGECGPYQREKGGRTGAISPKIRGFMSYSHEWIQEGSAGNIKRRTREE